MNWMVDKEEKETEKDKEDSNNPEKIATAGPMVSAHTTVQNADNPPWITNTQPPQQTQWTEIHPDATGFQNQAPDWPGQ